MAEFPKLNFKKFLRPSDGDTSSLNEAKYWRALVLTKQDKLLGSPNCIHFNPIDSKQYLVTYSTMVSLFDTISDSVVRSYTRFRDDAYSGRFRQDGKLIVCGDKEGNVKVFDATTKSLLRYSRQHSSAVRSTVWTADGLHYISGGDDGKINVWDLGTQEVVWDSGRNGHSDYVRSVLAYPSASNLFISTSYDQSIRIWDTRQPTSIKQVNHGAAVSACVVSPSGTMLFTAGGNTVKAWDLLSTSAADVACFSSHLKDVSSLSMDATGSRLLSGGLDSHIKIYNLVTMKQCYGLKFDSPVLSVALSPSNNKLIVGLVNGNLLAHTKPVKSAAAAKASTNASHRVSRKVGLMNDAVVMGKVQSYKHARLAPYEKLLKSFQYQNALSAAFKTDNPVIITSLIEELCRRQGLHIALTGRDEAALLLFLSYAMRFICRPKFTRTISQFVQKILDMYLEEIGVSGDLLDALRDVMDKVKGELEFQRQVMRLKGSIGAVVSASALAQLPRDRSTSIVDVV